VKVGDGGEKRPEDLVSALVGNTLDMHQAVMGSWAAVTKTLAYRKRDASQWKLDRHSMASTTRFLSAPQMDSENKRVADSGRCMELDKARVHAAAEIVGGRMGKEGK
jgi:hypothetical protein